MDKSIAEIKYEFKAANIEKLPSLIEAYKLDERKGVQQTIDTAEKTLQKLELERQRLYALNEYERKYNQYNYICGIDEVGRGPLAGPVVAAAVILPKNCEILYLNDSKKLSEKKREELYEEICQKAVAYGIGIVSHERIDEINILNATKEAMKQAIENMKETMNVSPDLLLIDAVRLDDVEIKQVPIIKGDAKSVSIASASIVAKVYRDRMMTAYDEIFPGYGFASNKGYGSESHIEMLKKSGPCKIHRKSFIKHFI